MRNDREADDYRGGSGKLTRATDMTMKLSVTGNELNRRDFLFVLTASGSVIALPGNQLLALPDDDTWPEHVEQFPALASDGGDSTWMASVTRPMPGRHISVDRILNGERKKVCILQPKGMTGIAAPAIAPFRDGCVVVFPMEKADRWHIAYAFVNEATGREAECSYIPSKGSSNISPAVTVIDDEAYIAWESNSGAFRGIYTCRVNEKDTGAVQRLSSPGANSYNPSITSLADGSIFAAWDSFRDHASNIHGAWHRDGKWLKEERITGGTRIERHPFVTSRNNELWITWQAQSYRKRLLNNLSEQRIVVARLADGGLEAPVDLFEKVSTPDRLLMRPRIVFAPNGNLWLTASLGMPSMQAGWKPVAWQHDGNKWSAMELLMEEQSRWHPIPVAFPAKSVSVAVESDDLPNGWDRTRGRHLGWKSRITVRRRHEGPHAGRKIETRPLKMPGTKFSLKDKVDLCSAELPRQQWKHNGRELTLFWGDLHDHTDISVCNRRQNPPGHDLFANLRDIEKLDFCALTDHGYNFDPQQWSLNGEQTRYNHDPGRFVTFLAQEWTSSKTRPSGGYGHRNIVYLDPYYDRFHDSFDGNIRPQDLWDELEGVEFICIPHQLADWKHKGRGNPPTDWSFTDERLQPVAEIFQHRESYEYRGCPRQAPDGEPRKGNYLQDAWARGTIIGVIASPDHGGGKGKAGVWAGELTREKIFEGIRSRHTFGTSGAKIALRFSSDNAMMGDKVKKGKGPVSFVVEALAMHDVIEVVIFRNNRIVYKSSPNAVSCSLEWTDKNPPNAGKTWYYTRIQCADKEIAWSSPIWFLP